jgi:hypothetical protein
MATNKKTIFIVFILNGMYLGAMEKWGKDLREESTVTRSLDEQFVHLLDYEIYDDVEQITKVFNPLHNPKYKDAGKELAHKDTSIKKKLLENALDFQCQRYADPIGYCEILRQMKAEELCTWLERACAFDTEALEDFRQDTAVIFVARVVDQVRGPEYAQNFFEDAESVENNKKTSAYIANAVEKYISQNMAWALTNAFIKKHKTDGGELLKLSSLMFLEYFVHNDGEISKDIPLSAHQKDLIAQLLAFQENSSILLP